MHGDSRGSGKREPVAYRLCLYVTGRGTNSAVARQSLRRIQTQLRDACHCEEVDVLEDPDAARRAGLAMVPALSASQGQRRIVFYGRLIDTDEIVGRLRGLEE